MPKKTAKKATIPSEPKKSKKTKKKEPEKKKKKVGHPPKYSEVEQLQKKIDEYFAACDAQGRPYTVTGLAFACDLTRQQLINYEYKEEFRPAIKRAKQLVEISLEEKLIDGTLKNQTGVIFNLKNNWGWQDKTNVANEVSVDNNIRIIGKDGTELEIPD